MGVTQANAALGQLPAMGNNHFSVKSPGCTVLLLGCSVPESGFTKGERRVNEDPDKMEPGNLATGIAAELWERGHQILMTDVAIPLTVRREVAFQERCTKNMQW